MRVRKFQQKKRKKKKEFDQGKARLGGKVHLKPLFDKNQIFEVFLS